MNEKLPPETIALCIVTLTFFANLHYIFLSSHFRGLVLGYTFQLL